MKLQHPKNAPNSFNNLQTLIIELELCYNLSSQLSLAKSKKLRSQLNELARVIAANTQPKQAEIKE